VSRPQRWLFPLFLVLAAGCGSDPVGPGAIPGLYVLNSIGGDPLPTFLYNHSLESYHLITAGHIEVNGDGTCSFVSENVRPSDGNGNVEIFTVDISGTWTAKGSTFTFNLIVMGASAFKVRVEGDALTVTTGGEPWVYVRS
jgi:hypothetical protein